MPIYEFVCRDCRTVTEFLVRNTGEKREVRCASCGSGELERVLSRVHSAVSGSAGSAERRGRAPLEERQCPSGTCSTITLPGHARPGG